MTTLWTIATFGFVHATLGIVAFATARMLGGFHRPQH